MSIFLAQKSHPYKHWEYLDSLTGDRLRLVPERGGLISEWRCNGKEMLYFDLDRFLSTNKSVRGGIPVLFPICGDLPNGMLCISQGNFLMNQHGFARDLPWEINLLEGERGISLTLVQSSKSKESFPFDFSLQMEVSISEKNLFIKTILCNTGEADMPFSFGLHPYFNVSDLDNVQIEGLPESCMNHVDVSKTSTCSQLAKLSKGIDILSSPRGPVSLIDLKTLDTVKMISEYPMDLAVIWTDPPRKMVCMEPWTGPRGSVITGERRLVLSPGASQKFHSRFVSN